MGFSVRTKPTAPGDSDEHLAALTKLIREHVSKLAQIVIRRHQGRGGFRDTELVIDVIPEKVDERKIDAEDLAATALDLADRHAQENGGARYQIRGLGEDRNNELKLRLFDYSVARGENWAQADAARARDAELLAGAELHRRIAQDSHRRYMEASAQTLELATTVRKLATEQNTDPVRLMKVAFKIRDRELEHEENVASSREWHENFRKAVDIVGPDIASVLGDLFRNYAGMNRETMSGPLAQRLKAFLGDLTPAQRSGIADALGEDAWKLLERAGQAGDDAEFKALAQKLRELWQSQGEREVTEKMKRVAGLLGAKTMALVQLLKDAGVVD